MKIEVLLGFKWIRVYKNWVERRSFVDLDLRLWRGLLLRDPVRVIHKGAHSIVETIQPINKVLGTSASYVLFVRHMIDMGVILPFICLPVIRDSLISLILLGIVATCAKTSSRDQNECKGNSERDDN